MSAWLSRFGVRALAMFHVTLSVLLLVGAFWLRSPFFIAVTLVLLLLDVRRVVKERRLRHPRSVENPTN